jgi:phospholipid/cholesterol/gamma-HCH transport system permease protein
MATESPSHRKPPGRVRVMFQEVGEFAAMSGRVLRASKSLPLYSSEVLRQASLLVRGSTLPVAALSVFMGFAACDFGYYFLRSAGAADYVGLFTGFITPRATAFLIFGYMFSAKVGCGIVAELGAMKINEEIDAYEVEGIDPMAYVVATRVAGALLFVPIAAVASLVALFWGAFLDAIVVLNGVSTSAFLRNHWGIQVPSDQLFTVATMATIAVAVVLVSCFYGLRTSGGPAEVGQSVSRSLMVNLVLVHIIGALFIVGYYGLDPRLPVGG